MREMWETFSIPFRGYQLADFEKRIADRFEQPEKITEFFDAFVRGRADLFPVLEDCLQELGILIGTNETVNTVFNALGIQVNAKQVIQKIHPESIAYMHLMANDLLLSLDLKADSLHWEVGVERQGRKLNISFAKEEEKFYPLLVLEEGSSTALRENWLH